MANENVAFEPGNGMNRLGEPDNPWEAVYTKEINIDKVMNLSVVGGKLCMTYNK